jgi:mannose-6-phosphate isomerase
MPELKESLASIDIRGERDKNEILKEVESHIQNNGYAISESDISRPWGGFFRLSTHEADRFLDEFFPDMDKNEARLGNNNIELSPKILIVSPEQRLSWQYHYRRSEVWRFLTKGLYKRSNNDIEPEDLNWAEPGKLVVFSPNERHRLIGVAGIYTLVAEVWQHTIPSEPSNEDDIVRVQDDYSRD